MELNKPQKPNLGQTAAQAEDSEDEEEPVVTVVVPLGEDGENDNIVATSENVKKDEDEECQSDGAHNVNNQLEQFRKQWQDELQRKPTSRSQSPKTNPEDTGSRNAPSLSMEEMIENQAKDYFIQGMEAEDDGMLSEAIYYYKKALQLVPDIESKIGSIFNKSPRDRVRQESESSMEGSEMEEDLRSNFDNLNLKEHGLCLPQWEQRMTHISVLPVELIINILRWVVSSDLDLRSLEMFSLVCKGFYMCARDETVWKLACDKIWGVNLGSHKKYGSSWRRMLIERPHLLFDGCYISRITYVRQGEPGVDSFYRPYHLVEYYRYVRFFPDGQVMMLVSPDDPAQSLPKLRYRHSKASGLLKGHYKLLDYKVTCVMRRVKSNEYNQKYKRQQRQAACQNDVDMIYSVEFDLMPQGKRGNTKLEWESYSVRTTYRSSNQESVSNFDLNKRTFPPLIFSRVKSYANMAQEQLA